MKLSLVEILLRYQLGLIKMQKLAAIHYPGRSLHNVTSTTLAMLAALSSGRFDRKKGNTLHVK